MFSVYFLQTIWIITLLRIDNLHAVGAVNGIAINPLPVTNFVIELDVVAMLTGSAIVINIVVNSLLPFLSFQIFDFSLCSI